MDSYESDFQVFLKHTNEKEILRKEISKIIKKFKVQSLLDIGAGNGDLSQPLSTEVEEYVCIEQKKKFANLLRKKGLDVIEGEFPLRADRRFDLVLCSHSIPYGKEDLNIFLDAAWKSVKPGGFLLVITYIGEGDDWNEFLKSINEGSFGINYMAYKEKLDMLKKFGKLKIKNVFSEVKTKNIEDMICALAFVAAVGSQKEKKSFLKKKSSIEKILEKKYRRKGGFFFPFKHIFILIKK